MVNKTNTSSRLEYCRHSKHGLIVRKMHATYFRQVQEEKGKVYREHLYVHVAESDIPVEIIRHGPKKTDKLKVKCAGCENMFFPNEVDTKTNALGEKIFLCRGYDGCSVDEELKELTIDQFASSNPVRGLASRFEYKSKR